MKKRPAVRKEGEKMVQQILWKTVRRASRRDERHSLHEERIEIAWVTVGPIAPNPAKQFSDGTEDHGGCQPPHFMKN